MCNKKAISIRRWMTAMMMMIGSMTAFTSCNKDLEEEINVGGGTIPENGESESKEYLVLYASKKGSLLSANTWKDYNSLGLYLTKGNIQQPYMDDKVNYSNIKATMLAGVWHIDPEEVKLTDEEAVIYVYSPYRYNAVPTAIPVETESKELYMYGTHLEPQKSVRKEDNVASLVLTHAMAIVDVNVRMTDKFQKNAVLQEITIEPVDSDTQLPVKGTMDIITGKITETEYGTYGIYGLKTLLTTSYKDNQSFRMTTIPRDNKDDELYLTIKVNGVKIKLPIDGKHDWVAGVRNVYNIIFDGQQTAIESVTIKPWKDIQVENGVLDEREGKDEYE